MPRVRFDVSGFQIRANADSAAIRRALEAGAELGKTFIYNQGRAMGVWRTHQTLDSIKVNKPGKNSHGAYIDITFDGLNKKGNRNAEVAFINEYGKRGQPARAFNRLGLDEHEEEIVQRMEDVLGDLI